MPSEPPLAAAQPFDVIISGGTVYDGTGAEPIRADVGLRGDRIVAIGDLTGAVTGRTIDARGKAVAPGFIDIHTHSDLNVLFMPGMESSLSQGVTTEVVGNCGFSLGLSGKGADFALERRGLERAGQTLDWDDLAGFYRRIEDAGVAINVASLAGHGTIRKGTMGFANRPATPEELATMQAILAMALEQGAIGLSSGLEYVPGMYADVAELTALAKIAAEAGTFYATHLRDEGDTLEEAVAEAIAVAEGAGIPLQLSHHKAERPRNWGKVVRTLAMVDAAEARGLDVLLDQYPYTAYQTGLQTIVLPAWAAGSPEILVEKLSDPAHRARVRESMSTLGVEYASVLIATCASHPEYQGKSIPTLAALAGQDERDFLLDLLAENAGWVAATHFALSENDIERVLADPRVMIGSDAVAERPDSPYALSRPHPRTYGTFARILSHYVRERGLLTLAEGIRRMTSLPAKRIGLKDRGTLAMGNIADVVIFDPATVHDTATFDKPALASGIEHVFVAGTHALANGLSTDARAGKVLRR